ncbi:hypothetical protein ONZ45_g15185 [Pleurotus djamor]|nr:hypothetical protein ONZ45_g15185 [Pleurotus djamor]
MPRLRVLAGTSLSSLTPITSIVNTNGKHVLESDAFEGEIVVNIKGLVDEDGAVREGEYFAREDRQGITWSIQVQGRFLTPHTTDDILFGNTFDKPLKLPWGSGAALKFMRYIDPVLEHDLASSSKPWALSPLIATMPYFSHHRASSTVDVPAFPPAQSLGDDLSQLHLAICDSRSSRSPSPSASSSLSSISSSSSSSSPSPSTNSSSLSLSSAASTKSKSKSIISSLSSRSKTKKLSPPSSVSDTSPLSALKTPSERRTYFSDAEHRKSVELGPDDVITTDFCYGFLQFSPSLALALPGGLSFDLMRYWDGQPVRFVCCERKVKCEADDQDDGIPWGRVFWCVVIELAE